MRQNSSNSSNATSPLEHTEDDSFFDFLNEDEEEEKKEEKTEGPKRRHKQLLFKFDQSATHITKNDWVAISEETKDIDEFPHDAVWVSITAEEVSGKCIPDKYRGKIWTVFLNAEKMKQNHAKNTYTVLTNIINPKLKAQIKGDEPERCKMLTC